YVYTGYVVVILWFINLKCRTRTRILQPRLNHESVPTHATMRKIESADVLRRAGDISQTQRKSGNGIVNGATTSPKKSDAFIAAKNATEEISNCVRPALQSTLPIAKKSMTKFAAMSSMPTV